MRTRHQTTYHLQLTKTETKSVSKGMAWTNLYKLLVKHGLAEKPADCELQSFFNQTDGTSIARVNVVVKQHFKTT